MPTKTVSVSGGMGIGGWLTLLFIALKLTHYISWSWWWVLAPMWIPLSIALLVLLAAAIVYIATH